MPEITSRCPCCKVSFKVTQNQLKIAEGIVKCGVCHTRFNAEEHECKEGEVLSSPDLLAAVISLKEREIRFSDDVDFDALLAEIEHETAPESVQAKGDEPSAEQHPVGWDLPGVDLSMGRKSGSSPSEGSSASDLPGVDLLLRPEMAFPVRKEEKEREQGPEAVDDAGQLPNQLAEKPPQSISPVLGPLPTSLRRTTAKDSNATVEPPNFLSRTKPAGRVRRRWLAMLTVVLVVVVLPGQYVYFYVDRFPPDLMYHPLTQRFCRLTGCIIPTQSDITLIRSRQLIISSHPSRNNALLANLVLINQADFAQHYPLLELTFRDINDRLIVQKRFRPEDYLKGEMAGAVFMPPWKAVRIEMELVDPGEEAVNYYLIILEN